MATVAISWTVDEIAALGFAFARDDKNLVFLISVTRSIA